MMGGLRTGMFAVPTAEFLGAYAALNRSCRQYRLNLPPDVKQRLWKILDEQVSKGYALPYDYIRHCCVQTMLQPLLAAIRPYELKTAPWPDLYRKTRREILAEELAWCPWTRLFLHVIAGTEVDREVSPFKTVILSRDFVELLRTATIDGTAVITAEPEALLTFPPPERTAVVTPMMVAVGLLALAVGGCFVDLPGLTWLFLGIESLVGLLLMHLVFVSTLPATEWNWLLVPFNPLPLVFWKWRAKWSLAFAGLILVWIAFMSLSPHALTDSALLVTAGALAVFHLKSAGVRLCGLSRTGVRGVIHGKETNR